MEGFERQSKEYKALKVFETKRFKNFYVEMLKLLNSNDKTFLLCKPEAK